MAKVSVSVDVPLSPEEAWQHASDLSRYSEWLTIHRVWRSVLPETIDKGTVVESIVEVKGMYNRIRWTIVNYRPPESLTLDGIGTGGVKVKMIGRVRSGHRTGSGTSLAHVDPAASVVTMDVHLGGPALFGPIGVLVAAGLRSDIQASLDRFVAVFA
ncbi:MAG TPA: toxin [Mycobacterium sp.]|jgi:hypothetical protein|nr:toxin [Mycobacterium sp.]